ncbi:MAG: DUF4364 family protein [Oscillospiraceae bacterium]|nr:DUF4364 family protein [Oscillospiraceae bacterium]
MSDFSFINDSLEIKCLILYIAARTIGPVPFEVLQEMSMCDNGVDYFNFSECLADLVRTGHLARDEEGLYGITDKGRHNAAATESSLPYTVRAQAEQKLIACNEQIKRKALIGAGIEERETGGYTVALSLSDELDNLMELRLLVTRRELAAQMQDRFRADAEDIYAKILALLYEGNG